MRRSSLHSFNYGCESASRVMESEKTIVSCSLCPVTGRADGSSLSPETLSGNGCSDAHAHTGCSGHLKDTHTHLVVTQTVNKTRTHNGTC